MLFLTMSKNIKKFLKYQGIASIIYNDLLGYKG